MCLENLDKYASKDEIGLAVFKAFAEIRLAVQVLGLRLMVLVSKLFGGSFLSHYMIYATHK